MTNKPDDVLTNERLIRLTRDLAHDPTLITLDEQQRYDIRHALVELQSRRNATADSQQQVAAAKRLQEILSNFDEEAGEVIDNETERGDLWSDIEVPVGDLRSLLAAWNRRQSDGSSGMVKGLGVIGAGWEEHSLEEKQRVQKDAGIPNLPTDMTLEARLAVSGAGPRAFEWSDKKHRLVYDLCREIERLSAIQPVSRDGKTLRDKATALERSLEQEERAVSAYLRDDIEAAIEAIRAAAPTTTGATS